ncbi:drug/metabolite exporter YedA [Polyangium spumosum]|uniref:Drug/metabolite exporter YedA n=1 Tax=Polyangium spumosum TaxID=889282 RepID=A0A6N7PMU8_9BACT|nr:drug/metabolite exporter YedA [Polyangium spumosum]MRG93077.1 drug/metabolite exporter YedA [Polyangium spumosum]
MTTTVPRFRAGVAPFAPRRVELDLAKGALWAQRLRGPFALACTSGSVWLTREGDPDDVVLSAGGCYRGADQGLVVVEALATAHITVSRDGFSGKMRQLLAALRQHWLVVVSLLSLYLIWGSTYLGMHIALETLPPFFMGGTRFLLAGGILFAALRLRGEASPSRKQWAGAALIGALMLACGNGFLAIGQRRGWVSSGVAAVVVTTMPLWMAVLASASAFRARRAGREGATAAPTRGEWMGLLVGFTGAALLHLGGAMGGSGGGMLLMMLSPFAWALGSLLSRSMDLPRGLMASAAQMVAGGAVMLSLSPILGEAIPLEPSYRSLAALAYLTVFGSIVGFSAYGYLIRNTRPAIATSYAYVNPLVAIVLGIWLGGEEASATTWLAALIVISGVVILSVARARPSSS